MKEGVLIDNDVHGWANEHEHKLLQTYKKIVRVGSDEIPRQSDTSLANYCDDHHFDLISADSRAYMYYFGAGIKTVQISRYDWDKKGDKPVYCIQIID